MMDWLHRARESDLFWSFRQSPVAMVSAFVAITLILAAVLAPLFAPYDPFNPATLNLMNGFTPPMEPNAFTGESFILGQMIKGAICFLPSYLACAFRCLLDLRLWLLLWFWVWF